jgi:hypothetical protein
VTNAEDGAEGVGTRTEIGLLAEELEGVALLLEGVFLRVAVAEDFDGLSLDFALLLAALAGHEASLDGDAGAGRDALEQVVGVFGYVGYDLDATEA